MILKNGTLKLIFEVDGIETYSDSIDCHLKETTGEKSSVNGREYNSVDNNYIKRSFDAIIDYRRGVNYHSVVGCEITDFDGECYGIFKVESCQKNNFVGNVKFELIEFNGE